MYPNNVDNFLVLKTLLTLALIFGWFSRDQIWFWYMVITQGYDKAVDEYNAYIDQYNKDQE